MPHFCLQSRASKVSVKASFASITVNREHLHFLLNYIPGVTAEMAPLGVSGRRGTGQDGAQSWWLLESPLCPLRVGEARLCPPDSAGEAAAHRCWSSP